MNELIFLLKKFALERCKLLLTNPNDNPNEKWSEDDIRICFNLYLDLMPLDHTLIQPLAQIYLAANADIKKMLLLIIDQSVQFLQKFIQIFLLLFINLRLKKWVCKVKRF
jgi:hypothetical protein